MLKMEVSVKYLRVATTFKESHLKTLLSLGHCFNKKPAISSQSQLYQYMQLN